MKIIIKIFLMLTALNTLVGAEEYYRSLHQTPDSDGKVGVVNQYTSEKLFGNGYKVEHPKYASIFLRVGDYEDGICSSDWHRFKIYIPKGTNYLSVNYTFKPNISLKANYTFVPDNSSQPSALFDHTNVASDYKSLVTSITDTYGGNTVDNNAVNGTGAYQLSGDQYFKDSNGVNRSGWLYISLAEYHSDAKWGTTSTSAFLMSFTIAINDKEAFNEWKSTMQFKSNGDPVSSVATLQEKDRSCTTGEEVTKDFSMITFGELYSSKDWTSLNGAASTYTPPATTYTPPATTYTPPATNTTATKSCPSGYTYMDNVCLPNTGTISNYTPPTSTGTTSGNCSVLPDAQGNVATCTYTSTSTSSNSATASSSSTVSKTCPSGYSYIDNVCLLNDSEASKATGGLDLDALDEPADEPADESNYNVNIASAASLFSGNIVKRSLGHMSTIDGSFYKYGDGKFDWFYVPLGSKKVYKLNGLDDAGNLKWQTVQGDVQTFESITVVGDDEIIFGAKKEEQLPGQASETIDKLANNSYKAKGYFINYAEGSYDWMYIATDGSYGFKLEGLNDSGQLKWTEIWK